MPVKVAISGATGRMGRRLCVLASKDPAIELVGAIVRPDHPLLGNELGSVEPQIEGAARGLKLCGSVSQLGTVPDVLVDFSSPHASVAHAREAASLGVALVVGTTGLDDQQTKDVHGAASSVPVIHAMNYSLGVNLLFKVAAEVAAALGDDFNIEVVEAHHNKKVDAPSGTAYGIVDAICATTGRTRQDLVHGREGQTGKRTAREIGMHALRMGSVVGDHTVHFGSDFERIEITHRAQDRDVFASGALRAAKWLAQKRGSGGMYSMEDVLFGK